MLQSDFAILYLLKTEISGEISYSHETFLYRFSVRRYRKRTWRTFEYNLTFLVRHYICATNLQKTCKTSALLTDSGADITILSLMSTQLHTRSFHWRKFSEFVKSLFQIPRWRSIILNLIAALSAKTYYVTGAVSWHFQFSTIYRTHSDLMSTVCIQ